MPNFSYGIRIPKERIAVLIGKEGITKKQLEQDTSTKINIDSNEGDVTVSGDDAISLYSAKEVIRAIGRGFNPEVAKALLKGDYTFELIDISNYARGKSHFERLRGRVIGSEGKSRHLIEELTETNVCVYGKTIGIIGEAANVATAKRAVGSILAGSPHSSVYKWLEKKRRQLKEQELSGIFNLQNKDIFRQPQEKKETKAKVEKKPKEKSENDRKTKARKKR